MVECLAHFTLDDSPRGEHAPLRIMQLTDLHHFPAHATEFDVRAAKGRVVPIPGGWATTPGGYSTTRDIETIETLLKVRTHARGTITVSSNNPA
eukprot:SAG11_NODE_5326_length_1594_cov_5.432107_1_plen_94_part_00